jgi:hypothetical protein
MSYPSPSLNMQDTPVSPVPATTVPPPPTADPAAVETRPNPSPAKSAMAGQLSMGQPMTFSGAPPATTEQGTFE